MNSKYFCEYVLQTEDMVSKCSYHLMFPEQTRREWSEGIQVLLQFSFPWFWKFATFLLFSWFQKDKERLLSTVWFAVELIKSCSW